MPHASHSDTPTDNDLVTLRFSVDSGKVTPGTDEVFISTCADGVIRVPKSLMKQGKEDGYVVFEARVPGDVAAAVRSICAELFRLTYTQEEA
jgi:hypothetical protein